MDVSDIECDLEHNLAEGNWWYDTLEHELIEPPVREDHEVNTGLAWPAEDK